MPTSRVNDLVAAAVRHDVAAFTDLYQIEMPLLIKYIVSRYASLAEDAQDIAQETMLRVWERGPRLFRETSSAHSWITTIATNLCRDRTNAAAARDRLHRQGAGAVVDVDNAQPAQAVLEHAEDLARRRAVLARISGRLASYRRVVAAVAADPYRQQDEIARAASLNYNTFKTTLGKLRRELRAAL